MAIHITAVRTSTSAHIRMPAVQVPSVRTSRAVIAATAQKVTTVMRARRTAVPTMMSVHVRHVDVMRSA